MGKLTFILGGARSGKSTYAQQLATQRAQRVLFVATAQALDEEMQARIAKHQAERPAGWQTLEAPRRVGKAVMEANFDGELVLLDCLTLLLNNLYASGGGHEDELPEDVWNVEFDEAKVVKAFERELADIETAIGSGPAEWVIVSNEVGLGLVPEYPLGRSYRDALGWANRRLAARADEAYLLAAGIPIPLHNFR